MVICAKCGKSLSTQQSLDYHLKNACINKKCQVSGQTKVLAFKERFSDIIILFDWEANIIDISKESAEKLGYTVQELIGTSGYDHMYEKDKEFVFKIHLKANRHQQVGLCGFRRIHKSGYLIPIISTGTYIDNGNFIEAYEKIIKPPIDKPNMVSFGFDGFIDDVNQSMVDEYGYTREEFQKMNIFDLTHPSDHISLRDKCGIVQSGKTSIGSVKRVKKNCEIVNVTHECVNRGNYITCFSKIIHSI